MSIPPATPAPSDKGDGATLAEKEDPEAKDEKPEKEAKGGEKMEVEVCVCAREGFFQVVLQAIELPGLVYFVGGDILGMFSKAELLGKLPGLLALKATTNILWMCPALFFPLVLILKASGL